MENRKHTFDRMPLAARFFALPARFYSLVRPTPLPEPQLLLWNAELATALNLDADPTAHDALAEYLAGNRLPANSQPLATVYCGHQFGVYVRQLGDGRAILIAETPDRDGVIQEIQLKGAGPTPYSRHADGRAVLRSSIREYLCSEAMFGLGIPTTRALSLVGSPQPVWRESVETAAVVARTAPTFVRFGHFEFYSHHDDHEGLRALAVWTIVNHYPECKEANNPYQALLEAVITRTASLMAQWQAVGFCHGVMNTDNMSILGLTIDYGPFGFLDGYDAGHICNHSDTAGRYAYNQQPQIGLWNLQALAQALLPLLDSKEEAIAALHQFQPQFEAAFAEQFRRKLGYADWQEADWEPLTHLFNLLQAGRTDWTVFWRALSDHAPFAESGSVPAQLRDQVLDRKGFDAWFAQWQSRADRSDPAALRDRMRAANPKYILRNHLAEQAIRKARDEGDLSELQRLAECLRHPFDEQPQFDDYAGLPPNWANDLSVSCSS